MKHPLSLIFLLFSLFLPAAPMQAADDVIEKTYCTQGIAYESIDALKLDLLNNAKKAVINELFGEFIVASTAVENFVVTKDQIQTSSLGFVRVEGNTKFHNGEDFADVCVTIAGYVTGADRAKFDPEPLDNKYCDADDDMTTSQLIAYVKDEAIIQALVEYDPKLKDADKDSLLQLVQKVNYVENGFISDTQTYCAAFEGEVVPVEVMAFLETDNTITETPKLPIEGVVAYYPFTGNANDASATGNDGVVRGARLVEDRFGNLESAYYFDGNGAITIPDSSSLNIIDAYTIMAWINPASFASTWQTILTKGPEPQEQYALFFNNAGYLHYVNNASGSRHYWNSTQVIQQINQWYHVTIIFDGKTIKSFVDGVETGKHEAIGRLYPNNHNIEIGTRAGGTFYYGNIDDVIIFNRALSDLEVSDFYTESQKHTLEVGKFDSN